MEYNHGYISLVAAWLALALRGEKTGTGIGDGFDVVYIDSQIYNVSKGETATVQYYPSCVYVFPDIQLDTPTTIIFPSYTMSLEVGWFASTELTDCISVVTTEVY